MVKASVAAPTPNSEAWTMSRAKPATRDSRVMLLKTAVERSRRLPLMADGPPG